MCALVVWYYPRTPSFLISKACANFSFLKLTNLLTSSPRHFCSTRLFPTNFDFWVWVGYLLVFRRWPSGCFGRFKFIVEGEVDLCRKVRWSKFGSCSGHLIPFLCDNFSTKPTRFAWDLSSSIAIPAAWSTSSSFTFF